MKKANGLCLVTGGTSPIGRYIVDMLLEKGESVRIVSRRKMSSWHSHLEVVHGDLRDDAVVDTCMQGVEALFHCAAEFYNQEILWDVNVRVTASLLEQVKLRNVKYVCHISSAGVLGANLDAWVDETTPCHPRNLYERSKFIAEREVRSEKLDASICVLRPVFVVSRERPGFLSYPIRDNWMDRLMIFFKGREQAHLVHARDVAAAAIYFLDKKLDRPECFYVSCDEDSFNTVGRLYACYHQICANKNGNCDLTLPFSLPQWVPYWVRRLRRGPCLHGRVKFSSSKLRSYGFTFPMGVRGAISDIVDSQRHL